MGTVIFPETDIVKGLIIIVHILLPSLLILPYPVLKGFLYLILLFSCKHGGFLIDYIVVLASAIVDTVSYRYGPKIQCILKYGIGIHSLRPIGLGSGYGIPVPRLILYEPFHGITVKIDFDTAFVITVCPCPSRCLKQLIDKCLIILRLDPCRTDPYVYLRCIKVFGLYLFQCFHIDPEHIRIIPCMCSGCP